MKRILAIVLSIAILVMAFPLSVFAVEPNVATDTWDGTTVEPTATDADGNIIINTAEELAWIALKGDSATAGKSYKVADGITAFYLTPNGASSYDNSSFERLKETLSADTDLLGDTLNKWHSKSYVLDLGGWASFQGNFDGNGITIYGMAGVSTDSGTNALFPYVKGDISFKNFTLTDSYVSSKHNVGGIVGAGFGNGSAINSISFEKCAVYGNYLEQNTTGTSAGWCSLGGLAGSIAVVTESINVDNCLIVNNNIVNASSALNKSRAFFAAWQNYNTEVVTVSIKNSITDVNPYSNGYYPNNPANYSNVYTTCTDGADYYTTQYTDANVKVLTAEQMQGEAAKGNIKFAWNINWFVGDEGEYPSINFGEPIRDPYVWDGSFKEPTETDDEGNIIINTVHEMAWVALRGDTATEGKSYKVADGIEYFDMNGAVGITADSTAEEVKNAAKTDNIWRYETETDKKGKVGAFRGNFDGNGVTIYNIYSAGYAYGALFPYVYNESTIKNVIVKASFLSGYHYSAGIVGVGELQKPININKCAVVNCYITDNGNSNTACKRSAAQFVAGTGNSDVNISNCFAANNTLSAAGFEAGFVGTSGDYIQKGISITNSISIGMYPYSTAKIGDLGKGLTQQLTVENVYSDVECDVAGFTTLTNAQMQGEAAKENMDLKWNTDWFVGAEGEYPVINFGEPIRDPYVWDGSFKEPTDTDAEGNIIINTVHEMAWIALRGGDATANKNYKVADGIKYFNMNGMENITTASTVEDVKAAVNTSNLWRLEADGSSPAFQGNFDGNGITVYNLYTGNSGRSHNGLFPATNSTAQGSITIENVAVVASYVGGYHGAGAIVGIANTGNTSTKMYFENISVKNCFIFDNNDTNPATKKIGGIIAGEISHNAATFNNCLAIDNEVASQGIQGGFFGNSSEYAGQSIVSNSIIIASNVEPVSINTALASKVSTTTYTNVYTDQLSNVSGVTTLENSKMQGAVASVTMESLDNSVYFFNTTTYPELYIFHDVVDGKCECGLEVAGDPCIEGHTLESVEGYEPTNFTDGLLAHDECSVCGKTFIDGVQKSSEELIIPMLAKTWNGTFVEPTTTDDNGNIIINTPEELAWVALRGGAATEGKNYVVAKDSVFNLNGMAGITPFSTVAEVKAATKNDAYKWQTATDKNDSAPFMGNFDGNGLIVYNLYTGKGRGFGALFPALMNQDGGSISIKNVTLLSSHIGGYHWAGGIVGYANSANSNAKLTIENTAVKNCFIYDNDDTNTACQRTTGVLVGHLLHTATTINNCLVVDNEISAQGIIGGLFGNTSTYGGANTVKNVISIGTSVQSMMVNYPISDKAVTYINVYTDQIASADGITTLTVDQMQGAAAAENMNLNWNINWAVGAEGEYPSVITDNAFYDEWDGTFVEPTKTDAEGNIIINSAEEMAWVALRGDEATAGKNYKVADGIKYFNMNGMVGITPNSAADDVYNAAKNETNKWNYAADGKTGTFYGNFDGNGVTIYNIYTAKGQGYGGLFPVTKSSSGEILTIKNVAVVASYFGGYHCAGAIVGNADAPDTSTGLLIENVIINNNFIYDNNDANAACQRTVGIIGGNLTHNATVINNCFASGNKLSAQGIVGGLFGNTSAYGSPCTVSNTIVLGTKVEPTSINSTINDKVALTKYANVYTDQATELEGVTTATVDEMTGNKLTLDWTGWFATTSLPELYAFHNVTCTDNGDGTHSVSCDDCDISAINTPHAFKDGGCVLCGAACGHATTETKEENRINATCSSTGSYDEVVYCTVCGAEISRENKIIDINPDAHVFTDDNDNECNECDFVRESDTIPGDANGDGNVNGRDYAMILQYLNDWPVEINLDNSDVNGDGNVNGRDYALLLQYLNDWPVELK